MPLPEYSVLGRESSLRYYANFDCLCCYAYLDSEGSTGGVFPYSYVSTDVASTQMRLRMAIPGHVQRPCQAKLLRTLWYCAAPGTELYCRTTVLYQAQLLNAIYFFLYWQCLDNAPTQKLLLSHSQLIKSHLG
eukprot:848686-Rhodomonas_salina.5